MSTPASEMSMQIFSHERPMRLMGIVGHSGMGKTTLLERLIPQLVQRSMRVSLVKHSHKPIDVDHPGKDSYRLRESGCADVVVVGRNRWAVVHELRDEPEPALAEILGAVRPCDLLLVEGMKASWFPKIEVWRAELAREPLWPTDARIVAVASDDLSTIGYSRDVTVLHLHDVPAIADFMMRTAVPVSDASSTRPVESGSGGSHSSPSPVHVEQIPA